MSRRINPLTNQQIIEVPNSGGVSVIDVVEGTKTTTLTQRTVDGGVINNEVLYTDVTITPTPLPNHNIK